MDLSSKFRMLSACEQIKISALKQNVPYPIERAESPDQIWPDGIGDSTSRIPPDVFESVFNPDVMGFCLVMKNCDNK